MNLTQEITRLRDEHDHARKHLQVAGEAIQTLETLIGGRSTGMQGAQKAPKMTARTMGVIPMPSKRKLTKAGRAKIAAAQKARWAKLGKVGKKAA